MAKKKATHVKKVDEVSNRFEGIELVAPANERRAFALAYDKHHARLAAGKGGAGSVLLTETYAALAAAVAADAVVFYEAVADIAAGLAVEAGRQSAQSPEADDVAVSEPVGDSVDDSPNEVDDATVDASVASEGDSVEVDLGDGNVVEGTLDFDGGESDNK